jgi:hypothetical protein
LLNRVTTLKDAGFTDRMVLRVFLFHHVLPLKARPAPMWEYIGLGDQSTVVVATSQRSI